MPQNQIPDRWETYTNIGKQIPGTRLIPFKVPLKPLLCRKLKEKSKSFTPDDLLDELNSKNASLGLIIDLTKTTRYYDATFFKNQRIRHVKLEMDGQGKVPHKDVVKRFIAIVNDFEEEHSNDLLIGVHCTHGVNRTGYLICKYLIDYLNWLPEDAITAFERARGHSFDHVSYIQNLRQNESKVIYQPQTTINSELPVKKRYSRSRSRSPPRLNSISKSSSSRHSFNRHNYNSSQTSTGRNFPRFGNLPPPPPPAAVIGQHYSSHHYGNSPYHYRNSYYERPSSSRYGNSMAYQTDYSINNSQDCSYFPYSQYSSPSTSDYYQSSDRKQTSTKHSRKYSSPHIEFE